MGCSVGLKYAKNALAAGALPQTPLGNLRCSPDILVGWGGGHQSQCPIPLGAAPSVRFVGDLGGGLTPHWLKMTPTLVTENY